MTIHFRFHFPKHKLPFVTPIPQLKKNLSLLLYYSSRCAPRWEKNCVLHCDAKDPDSGPHWGAAVWGAFSRLVTPTCPLITTFRLSTGYLTFQNMLIYLYSSIFKAYDSLTRICSRLLILFYFSLSLVNLYYVLQFRLQGKWYHANDWIAQSLSGPTELWPGQLNNNPISLSGESGLRSNEEK